MADLLGAFEQTVLLAILQLGEQAYGRAILNRVQELLDREVSAGAVHATLERLESKGMVVSRAGDGTEVRAGRPRRYFSVAPAGIAALQQARQALDRIWKNVRLPLQGARA